jgi:hypothetical protein
MLFDRRTAVRGIAGTAAALLLARLPHAQTDLPPHPSPSKFEAGDFLWTARPDEIIPFDTSGQRTAETDAERWGAARDAFVRQARQSGDPALQEAAERLQRLTYDEVRSFYLEDRSVGDAILFGRALGVGHVAILDVAGGGDVHVIEARPPVDSAFDAALQRFRNGVVRTPYVTWIAALSDYRVWHGRVRGFGPPERRRIAAEASRFIGRDYWFWGLNLMDETCFYCSKLCWLSAYKALRNGALENLALDGDPRGARSFWLSPKRLMQLPTIEMVQSAGPI